MCVLTYSDPPRAIEIARIILQSNEGGGRRNARVACSSNRPRKKKESDRITDPLFAQKLCFFGEKVRHPILPFYPHFYAHKLSLFLSLSS